MLNVLKAFFAGVTVGVLFAPQSGAKTRQKIADVFTDLKDDAKDYVASAIDTVESKVHTAKKTVENI
jgi:gas vesicle protein